MSNVESITRKVLSGDEVEILNAHGPYSMAVWRSGDIEIGNEEGLKGRSAFFIKRIREAITKNFTMDEIKTFSILDVGCNDGWVLQQLNDLPFVRMVGIEPREKNIAKGRKVREILNIPSKAEYKVGDIETLGDEMFDIVICAGVLYHVESIPTSLRQIRKICKRMLFIESRCISSEYTTEKLKHEIEMRDVVYQYKDKLCGLTAQKFETAYNDGSAKEFCIVNIPTVESLIMYLDILGFDNIQIVADVKSYRTAVWKSKRPLNGVCMAAFLDPNKKKTVSDELAWITEYEKGLEATVLNENLIKPLYDYFCKGNIKAGFSLSSLGAFLYLKSPDWLAGLFGSLLKFRHKGKYELEIIKNLRYSPRDKVGLEYGKILFAKEDYKSSASILKDVTTQLNADWRAVYRSFSLLSQIYKKLGLGNEERRYRELYLNCNSRISVK